MQSPIVPLMIAMTGAWVATAHAQDVRPRARDVELVVGTLPTGPLNAITDVDGVRVGHATVRRGDSIRTGVTAIVPQPGNLYWRPVPGWIHSANGYGKLIGETQVREFGEIETPILLTCTMCVWSAAEALADYLLGQPGETEHTINPVVGETNDSQVNDMWADAIGLAEVRQALESASAGPVAEGSVGAGTGTTAFGWKGGIGTSSRRLPASLGGWTVGVLVQTNFGGTLTMNGAPVGRELGRYAYRSQLEAADGAEPARQRPAAPGFAGRGENTAGVVDAQDGGSIMMVAATDAPLTGRGLERLARRAMMGLARTGSYSSNSSGDYVIAFSTAASVRRDRRARGDQPLRDLPNPDMSPLFAAVVEATEESVYNAMLRATTVTGRGRTLEALPLDATLEVLERYRVLGWQASLPPGRR